MSATESDLERYEYALRWIASGAADRPDQSGALFGDPSWPMGRRRMKKIAEEALRPRCDCCNGSGRASLGGVQQ